MELPYVDVSGVRIGEGYPVRIMGILNLSPESFYRDSVAIDEDSIRQAVARFEREGADIIDIGGASTAPRNVYGTPEVGVSEELRRVTRAIAMITTMTKLPLSIDTVSSMVASKALDLGASIINDVSGLVADSKMARLVADSAVPVILMANCGNPCVSYQASMSSLRSSLSIALEAGIESNMILVDPGIGFGKQSEVDYEILRNLHAFTALHHPVLVGVSRKAFIGNQLGQPDPSDRLLGSIAATSVAVCNGASVIRTHDVKETKIAVVIGEAIRGSSRGKRRDQREDSE